MALKATVFRAEVQISDLDRHHYATHGLTLARHPSETDERMMVRLLAFCLFAHERLTFTRGLCVDDEPDLWQLALNGEIERWIDVGQPDPRRVRRACGRAREVVVVSYGGRAAEVWWQQQGAALAQLRNLRVLDLPAGAVQALGALAGRGMALQCTIDGGEVWIGTSEAAVEIAPVVRQG
jgi:uncharacterized protein YaeQ